MALPRPRPNRADPAFPRMGPVDVGPDLGLARVLVTFAYCRELVGVLDGPEADCHWSLALVVHHPATARPCIVQFDPIQSWPWRGAGW
jgi:hypothetical protein